jgi:hypothetical protein
VLHGLNRALGECKHALTSFLVGSGRSRPG